MTQDDATATPIPPKPDKIKKQHQAKPAYSPYTVQEQIDIYIKLMAEGKPWNEVYIACHPGYSGKQFTASVNGKAFYVKHKATIDAQMAIEHKKTKQIVESLGVDLSRETLCRKIAEVLDGQHNAKAMDILKACEVAARMMGYNAPTVSLSGKVDPVKALSDVIRSRLAGVPAKELPQSTDVMDVTPITPANTPKT